MKRIISALAVALVLAGCAKQYDDTDLRNRVTTLETKVGNLEAQMKAANAVALGQYVLKVEKTDEGVTVTYGDGTVVTLKISAGGAGSLTYVVLYILKTFVQNRLIYGYEMEAVLTTMVTKGVTSLANGVIAVVVAVILNKAMRPALERAGTFDQT